MASSFQDFYKAMATSEKKAFEVHYGKPESDCKYTNLCVFVTDDKLGTCTKENTGLTGGVKKPSPPTSPPGGGGNWNQPPGNGWGDAGVGRSCVISKWNVIIGVIFIITVL